MVKDATGTVTVDAIVARARELATLPDVYLRIKRILDDPASSHHDFAEALQTDPAMAARLLRVANSAFYGRPGSITTITRAVGLLGTQQVHDLVLATAVIQSFSKVLPDSTNSRDFWRASVLAATTAKLLAEHCGFLDAERMFVAGLLAQLGQLILLEELPVQTGSMLYMAEESTCRPCDLQIESLGFDYAAVGAALFTAWQLPAALTEPVRLHTYPAEAIDFALEAAIVHVAVESANAQVRAKPVEHALGRIDAQAWRLTGLSIELFEQLRRDARELASELTAVMFDQAA